MITLRNAHQNTLKHLDLELPYGELIVITGVSGSGKSTLAFDTIYAEGQRRYVETFSPYARQFLDRMDRPRVDEISGIPPAIAIDQSNPVRTSRSTVGTMTELNDHLKLLFARTAKPWCKNCGTRIQRDHPGNIVPTLTAQRHQSGYWVITFPITVPDNFSETEVESWLERQGYTRIHARDAKTLQVVQDRVRCDETDEARLNEAVEIALRQGQGEIDVHRLDCDRKPVESLHFSEALACSGCGLTLREPTPSTFSFNSPIGACESCRGFGRVMGIDYRLVIPDGNLTLSEGAIKPFQSKTNQLCQRDMVKAAPAAGVPLDKPWKSLTPAQQRWVIEGERVGGKRKRRANEWYGVDGFFRWLEGRSYKMHVRVMLSKYRSYEPCPSCQGARLKPEALWWRVGELVDRSAHHRPPETTMSDSQFQALPGYTIVDLMQMPVSRLHERVHTWLAEQPDEASAMVLEEMATRLGYLAEVGLGYLNLDRQSRTLSGGEVQRINLTTALGTSLVNTLFVLDEPSIGLHAADLDRLIKVLLRLRDAGNTLIVVEHDPAVMRAADRLIDLGPGPGHNGGHILYNGPPDGIERCENSLTADWLSGRSRLPAKKRHNSGHAGMLELIGAHGHNLKHIDVRFPLNQLVVLSGPSGSGKSTLLNDTLYNALMAQRGQPRELAEPFDTLMGSEHVDVIELIDQAPIGKSARSNPVSYCGGFETIRKCFAAVPEARARGYTAGSFSFNSGLRCPVCSGNGHEHVEMQFLSDVYLPCAACNGTRYQAELLDIHLFGADGEAGLSIAEVLSLTIDQAMAFFADRPDVQRSLQPLVDVGLGHLQLGQPVPTLSGGEAQRLKLAAHLIPPKKRKGASESRTLFLFDEPTTGLHFADIARLLEVFDRLLERGHSLVVIEHNLDVIAQADYLIELGPGGGAHGGELVFTGTPAALKRNGKTLTARALNGEFEPAPVNSLRDESARVQAENAITVHHAREHNLKNLDASIPRDAFTVVTGLSGSGKSTLAFDLIFNEGQRRYLESLNAYARQFVQPAARPEVDAISGIPPTVAIEQRTSRGGHKSTVATMTELYHFIRLLFTRLGEQYCPECGLAVSSQSAESILSTVLQQDKGNTITILAPLVAQRKGVYTEIADWAQARGHMQLRVDGELLDTENFPRLDRYREHTIELPIATLKVSQRSRAALEQAIQRALEHGSGQLRILHSDHSETLHSLERTCPECQRGFPELDPRMFSWNAAYGWCPDCFGTGLSLVGFDAEHTGEEAGFEEADSEDWCRSCDGTRLRPEALSVWFADATIDELTAMSIEQAEHWFRQLKLDARAQRIARDILSELKHRLSFLKQVGLDYLTLDRAAPTLSGGEAQRIRLAAQLGSNLQGVCYVLDEPTIGLHPRDNARLLDSLVTLRDQGNTVLVVEHDEATIRRADHLLDIGPGAGSEGGRVVACGSVADLEANPESVTGRLLAQGAAQVQSRSRGKPDQWLSVQDAHLHNLHHLTIELPLRRLVAVSGVSGSGKSTLLRRIIHDNLVQLNSPGRRKRTLNELYGVNNIDGWQDIDRVLEVDQTPIGRTPRSCPATYVGFWDAIRRVFADTTEARIRGYGPGRFSFNISGGRCDECDGQGLTRVEMNFLPDVKVPCESCGGTRFNRETRAVRWREHDIGEVLNMSVNRALELFESHPAIRRPLQLLQQVGLGYLRLGQHSPTLSGGEAQRIKLVAELARTRDDSSHHTLYILDEPTVGLHMADVSRLVTLLQQLVDSSNSVMVIEHNLELIAAADWMLDLGPEAGAGGGRVVVKGTPAQVSRSKRSRTAPYLAELTKNQ